MILGNILSPHQLDTVHQREERNGPLSNFVFCEAWKILRSLTIWRQLSFRCSLHLQAEKRSRSYSGSLLVKYAGQAIFLHCEGCCALQLLMSSPRPYRLKSDGTGFSPFRETDRGDREMCVQE